MNYLLPLKETQFWQNALVAQSLGVAILYFDLMEAKLQNSEKRILFSVPPYQTLVPLKRHQIRDHVNVNNDI